MTKKRVVILGCTGSIGTSTLEVIRRLPHLFEVAALSAHNNKTELIKLAEEFSVPLTAISSKEHPAGKHGKLYTGRQGLLQMIRDAQADIVVNGIAGASGLEPSLAALEAGSDLALANKETMVMAGPLIQKTCQAQGCRLLPVDSEHSALFFLTMNIDFAYIEELILTASGGPFRNTPLEDFPSITPTQALNHPTWSMGAKISIDSATMANKGLEVIEAARLFPLPPDRIKVLVHPQSRVHSLVRWKDGSLYAQISKPSMELPIQNALTWPQLEKIEPARLDLTDSQLSFEGVNNQKFPLLGLAYQAAEKGGSAPIVYNAANEVAVAAFLEDEIRFTDIAGVTETVLERGIPLENEFSLPEILNADRQARIEAQRTIERIKKQP